MRLGVVGMLPADFRAIDRTHLDAIRELGLSGAAFHAPGDKLFDVTDQECAAVRQTFSSAGMDLPQFGVGYGECLFDPDEAVRKAVLKKIGRGIEVAVGLGAGTCLIRTGSLNPDGSYAPAAANHSAQSWDLLIDTLTKVCAKAESEGITMVLETHVLTIADSPESNGRIRADVGSDRMGIVMDYVNHFQNVKQVFDSTARIDRIFDVMGHLCPVGHCKDIRFGKGLVIHIDEEVPGDGLLDLQRALKRWHDMQPDGYMLLEHLPNEKYPRAAANVHRILKEAGIAVH